MKILYGIQGTGNGHISRARDIIPILQKFGELHILVSGTECDLDLPFEINYRFKGLSFVFGKKGGIDLLKTYRKGNLKRLFNEIKELPVQDYDLVISDFEPVTSWACRLNSKPCIGLSHQAAVISKDSPKPEKTDVVGRAILKNYAPVTTSFGFHFETYNKDIFTPVIRSQVRNLITSRNNHYTVYLPAYSDNRIIDVLSLLPDIQWQVFSKHAKFPFEVNNVFIKPISNEDFLESLSGASGVLCGAGFETPAEVIFLNKKLMVIPMKGQYEQQCNAAALKELGVPVIKSLKKKHFETIREWVASTRIVGFDYEDNTHAIIETIIKNIESYTIPPLQPGKAPLSWKKLRELNLGKILKQASH